MIQGRQQTAGKTETAAGAFILAVLIVIGVSVFLAQYQYNPAVYPLSSGHRANTAATPADVSPAANVLFQLPAEMAPLGDLEHFSAATLSDKINGKAELYLSAGFVSLRSRRYKLAADSDPWAEFYLYDMGNPRNAYSVFSSQRRDNAATIALTPNAYRTENAVYLAHGPYYVEIVGSVAAEQTVDRLVQLASSFVESTAVAAETVSEKALFPENNRIPDSITLLSKNVFGFDALNDVFVCRYRFGEKTVTAFLSKRENADAARAMAEAFEKFLTAFGGKPSDLSGSLTGGRLVEIFDTYDIIFTVGPYLAGIHEADDRLLAEQGAAALKSNLQENAGGS